MIAEELKYLKFSTIEYDFDVKGTISTRISSYYNLITVQL